MMPAVLCLGAGTGQLPLIRAAKKLGYNIVAVDRSPISEALGLIDEAIIVSTYDVEHVVDSVLKLNSGYSFCAVLARTSGPALLTASKLSEALDLSGIPLKLANASVSKSELRQQAHSTCTATPQGDWVNDGHLPGFSGPWVVKPDMPLVGKKNVYKVNSEKAYQQAYMAARAESYNNAVEVEEYIAGVDVGFMAIVLQGKIEHSLLYDEFAGFIDEKIKGHGVGGPSIFSGSSIEGCCRDIAEKLLSHWQYQTGFVFFSFRINNRGEAFLYEVNPGLCGDAIADTLLPTLWSNFCPFVCEVQLQMGTHPDFPENISQKNLLLDGRVIHVNSQDDYLSCLDSIAGGDDIVAMYRTILIAMQEK